ncbi:alpha/beta fold hydrolase [Desulfobacterales bacterium HSG2]|nr:alpha/beta fold hydrolase [Desulfobacterales bacterium HSG2]
MKMQESFLKIGDDYLFFRSNEMLPNRETLLFVHGLGESGLCFQEVFEDKRFNNYNVLVPDLIGYGRSSNSETGNYNFDSHVFRLSKLIESYQINNIILIGHSMGGDITTLLCKEDREGLIKKYVNIEGDITQFDIFISNQAVKAYEENRFNEWFYDEFINSEIYESFGKNYRSCRRYHASLYFCRAETFLSNAQELLKRNTSLEGQYKSEIGSFYCDIEISKVYCYGTKSLSDETVDFLKINNLNAKAFNDAFHWLMIDKAEEFYDFLFSYISK